MPLLTRRLVNRARFHLASAILGRGWFGAITRLQIIADRAERCITPDGRVVLALCKPLAEALYSPIPGEWTLTVTGPAPTITQEAPCDDSP